MTSVTSSLLEWSNSFQSDELKKRSLASVKQLQIPVVKVNFRKSSFNSRERFKWNHQQVNEPGKIDCTYMYENSLFVHTRSLQMDHQQQVTYQNVFVFVFVLRWRSLQGASPAGRHLSDCQFVYLCILVFVFFSIEDLCRVPISYLSDCLLTRIRSPSPFPRCV